MMTTLRLARLADAAAIPECQTVARDRPDHL